MESSTHWIDYVTAIGAVATPIIVLVLSAIGWRLRHKLERRVELEDKLREYRIEVYGDILEPYIIFFTSDEAWKSDPKQRNKDKMAVAIQKTLSLDYRKKGFRLALMGSDEVVRAYNNLMQFFFQRSDGPATPGLADVSEMMSLVGTLLLEIRRSMGNEGTTLKKWEMLEWFMADARKHSAMDGA